MHFFPKTFFSFFFLLPISTLAFLLPSLPNQMQEIHFSSPLLSSPTSRCLSTIKPVNIFPEQEKEKLTRDNEPDQYFRTNLDDKSTKEKLNDPLVLIGIG